MEYILLRDYYPFRAGRIVRLPPQTAAKLEAQGVVAPYPGPIIVPVKPKVEELVAEPKPVPEAIEDAIEAAIMDPIVTGVRTRKAPIRPK